MRAVKDQEFPHDLLPSLRDVEFVCPLCHGCLSVSAQEYDCGKCQKKYPLHAGIPDFRVFPDPYLDFEEDRERTEIVLAGLEKYELEKLLEYYWSFSDITPENLRAKFVRSAMLGEERSRQTLNLLENTVSGKINKKRVLEIGSGTGNFMVAAAGNCGQIIGTDIAMRWLHLSRRRFMDKGLPIPALVCCCAEFLPFGDESFDLVTSTSTVEFVSDQLKVIGESYRVLKSDGAMHLSSVNRFSVAKEPYSYLWGVGFLPAGLRAQYVRWRSNAVYKANTLSYRQIKDLTNGPFSDMVTLLPDISASSLASMPQFTRFQIYIYRILKKIPLFSLVLRHLGPGWDIFLRKNPHQEKGF